MNSLFCRPAKGVRGSTSLLLASASLLVASLVTSEVQAQSLTIMPVTIQMEAGQATASLTVINQNNSEMNFQVRSFAWAQPNGQDELVATEGLEVSPPLGAIPANTSQVVRMVLAHPPTDREDTYRILLDQIPTLAEPGTVKLAIRLSIPVFAEPSTAAVAQLQWRVERNGPETSLVAVNAGNRHEKISDVVLTDKAGHAIPLDNIGSPYILPGVTRRWKVLTQNLSAGAALKLTAKSEAHPIDQAIAVSSGQ